MHDKLIGLRPSELARWGRETRLGDRSVGVVAIVVFAAGVVLLVAAFIPPRRRLIEPTETDPVIAVGLTPRGLRRVVRAAAVSVDGVITAKVTGRRRMSVAGRTSLRQTSPLPALITDRVAVRLTELGPATDPVVRVDLNRKDG